MPYFGVELLTCVLLKVLTLLCIVLKDGTALTYLHKSYSPSTLAIRDVDDEKKNDFTEIRNGKVRRTITHYLTTKPKASRNKSTPENDIASVPWD